MELIVWLVGWLVDCLFRWLVGWLVGGWLCREVGRYHDISLEDLRNSTQ